jgi:trk system potassium uptake protein TrkH
MNYNHIQKFTDMILNYFAGLNLIYFLLSPVLTNLNISSKIISIYTLLGIFIIYFKVFLFFKKNGLSSLSLQRTTPDFMFVSLGLIFFRYTNIVFNLYLFIRQFVIWMVKLVRITEQKSFIKKIFHYPALIILISFLSTILLGTLFLMSPVMTETGEKTSFIGAAFTATSAVCVTGLSIYDISSHFTVQGQLVILLLIQVGGLGIMTISTGLAIMLGQRFSVQSEKLINYTINQKQNLNLFGLVKKIVFLTLFIELIGAIILFFPFYKTFNIAFSEISVNKYYLFGKAMYHAIFHSISAFCNAGFSLYPDSLLGFYRNFSVVMPISILFILGGLGFTVLSDLKRINLNPKKLLYLTFHSKIVLISSLLLLVIGSLVFFISEYQFTMKDMNLYERLLSSFFQSATCRTAGFNTINTSLLSNSSVIFSCLLMFIGASPGSTGGGIKTPTFAIIVLAVFSFLRGNRDVTIFSRKISDETMVKVLALIGISVFFLFSIIFLMLMTEPFKFQEILFEAFSAFGTVGLSMGITAALSSIGKFLIIILMFIGRVGPLTFVFALAASVSRRNYQVPEEQLDIG